MNEREWYSVKCVFEIKLLTQTALSAVYEERIVVLKAISLDDAIKQGLDEAREYEQSVGDGSIKYSGFISAYHTYEKEIAVKSEVFSMMRKSNLPLNEYLTHFYDDGNEIAQIV